MQLNLGDRVLSSDLQDLGTVKYLILDPADAHAKTFVVEKGWLLHDDTEIPIEALRARTDGSVTIRYTADEVKRMPGFDPRLYMPLTAEQTRSVPGYAPFGLMWPNGYAFPPLSTSGYPLAMPLIPGEVETPSPPEVQERLRSEDEAHVVISEGDGIISRDGQKIGEVHNVAIDTATGRPTHLTVRRGWLFHNDWDLPAKVIDSVEDGEVRISLDAAQLGNEFEHTQPPKVSHAKSDILR